MSKIQIGDRARDTNGVLWECRALDIGERYSVGTVPISRTVLDNVLDADAMIQAIRACEPSDGNLGNLSGVSVQLWQRKTVEWISASDWRNLVSVLKLASIKPVPVTRETDVGDLTGLIGRRHLERCSDCGRYKYLVEVCPHCNEALIDTGVGRQVQSVIEHQAAALCFAQLAEDKT